MAPVVSSLALELFTDTVTSTVFGGYFAGQWCAEAWPVEWKEAGFLGNLVVNASYLL